MKFYFIKVLLSLIITLFSWYTHAQISYIQIISSPGTSIYLDTTLIGETSPGKGEIKIENLLPGKYRVSLRNGDETLTEEIVITDVHPRILYADPGTGKTEDRSPVNRKSKYELLSYENPHVDYGKLTDPRDQNSYRTIKIGKDTWMAENLDFVIKGDAFIYPLDPIHEEVYGRLYTWEQAQKVCPAGWHLASDMEWRELERCLGIGDSILMVRGWRPTNADSTLKSGSGWLAACPSRDDLGFAAFPGGFRDDKGYFFNEGYFAYFWTASGNSEKEAWYRVLVNDINSVGRFSYSKEYAFSVRCVKD